MKKFTDRDFLHLQHDEADRRWGKGARIRHKKWREMTNELFAFVRYMHANGFIDASELL